MTLIINSVDYSAYIQQTVGISETPRRVEGKNGGMSIDFDEIYDEGVTKYDAQFSLMPLPASMMRQLLEAAESVPSDVQYTSVLLDTERAIEARVSIATLNYLTTARGERIYGESVITITER